MKLKLTILITSIFTLSFSQNVDTSYKDLGLHKKVVKVESKTYSIKDKMVTDKSSDVYTFDENGAILYHEFNILGEFSSATFENSKYENGNLIERNITVKDRPNFTSKIICQYDDNSRLIKRTNQAKYYNNVFVFTYNADNRLEEVKGTFNSNYSIEKYFYENDNLYKTKTQLFKNDTVYSEQIKLFIDNKEVIEFDYKNKFSQAFLKDNKVEMLVQLNFPNQLKQLELIETKIINENYTTEMLKDFLLNKENEPFVKIIVNEKFINNENTDWIAKMGVDKMHKEEQTYFTFRKITYADGTDSGTTEFSMSKINELRLLQKSK